MQRNPKQLIVVEPRKTSNFPSLRELVAFRELLYFLVWRDIKVRYRQTLLGFFWVVLQPLMVMAVYSMIFGSVMKLPRQNHPYALYVITGIVPWIFFSGAVSESGNSLLANAHLIGKIYFPRLYLPTARILVLLFDFSVATLLLTVAALWVGAPKASALALLPLGMAITVALALGSGALLSALNAKYRDLHYIVPFALQLWMFATPIIYPVEVIPAQYRWLVALNPMAGVVELFRSALLGGPLLPSALLYSGGISLLVLLVGAWLFESVQYRLTDIM